MSLDEEAQTKQAREAEEDFAKEKGDAENDPLALIRREIAVMKKLE